MVLVDPRVSRERSPRTPKHAKSGLRGLDELLEDLRGAPGGSLKRFRELAGSFWSIFWECVLARTVFFVSANRRKDAKCSSARGNARSVSFQSKFEKKTVANGVESASSACCRARFNWLQFRFRGRRKWPQAFRISWDTSAPGLSPEVCALPSVTQKPI